MQTTTLPGIGDLRHGPDYYIDAPEHDETPVVFCERCREELDADRVDDDGLHFHAACLAAIVAEAEAEARRVA